MPGEVTVQLPALLWCDVADGKRVLYAGNLPDHVAEVEHDGIGWCFTVFLPGEKFKIARPLIDRSAVEAFVSAIVEAWFAAVYA